MVMTSALAMALAFTAIGVLMIRFRNEIARFKTGIDQAAFPFLPKAVLRVTPSGVILAASIWFLLAVLSVIGGIVEAGAR